MKRIVSLIVFLLILGLRVNASFLFNENCIKAYKSIMNLDFQYGKIYINTEKKANPNNKIPYYLDNYIDFLKVFISEDRNLFENLKANKDERITNLMADDANSPYYLYTQAEMQLQWAFLRLKFGEYIKASMEIKKAYELLEINQKKFPEFYPNKKGLGLLHAIIGTVPASYQTALNLIGMKGTIKEGIHELEEFTKATNRSEFQYLRDESLFYLMLGELNLNNNEAKALEYADKNLEALTTSPLLVYVSATTFMRTGKNEKAILLLQNQQKVNYKFHFLYLDYLLGTALLNTLNKDAAIYLDKYVRYFKGQNYIKSAYLKLAWTNLLENKTLEYYRCIDSCKTHGNAFVEEDKLSLKEASKKSIPNIYLLKSRLLFDGGNYNEAFKIIASCKPTETMITIEDKVEYIYRVARIYHKLNQTDKAIKNYLTTIQIGKDLSYYYAANASLQLGLIYEKQGAWEDALRFYNLSMKLKNTDYKESIEQKAKAGINRVRSKQPK